LYKLFSEKNKGYLSIIKSPGGGSDAIFKLEKRPIELFRDHPETESGCEKEASGPLETEKSKEEIFEEIRSQAAEQGFEQGYKEGMEKALDEFDEQIKTITRIRAGVIDYRIKAIKDAESEIAKLGLLIAKKIIRKTIEEKKEIVADCINFALKSVSQIDELVIRLNPDDYKIITDKKSKTKKSISRSREIKFVEDRRVEKGGCIVETRNGDIDARPSSQLKIAERIINKKINQSEKNGN
jgi:flagellar assembly protein FliH